jgi:putative solute:sodium symporter small subunit
MSDPSPPERPRRRTSATDPEVRARHEAYWRRNLRYLAILLAVWAVVSYGFGILLAGPLDAVTLPGTAFPLGFWFAQQGSIYVFVILIFVYVVLMNRLDREFDVDEGGEGPAGGARGGTAAGGGGAGAFPGGGD